MKRKSSFLKIVSLLLFTFFAFALYAGHDVPLNGDFKGAVSATGVDGWQLISGKFRRLPTRDRDDFALELSGSSIMRSVLYPVIGNILKLEGEVSGFGLGRIGYAAFDRNGKLISAYADGIRFSAVRRSSKVKASLPVAAETAFVAVVLETSGKSKVVFEDIDAEFYGTRTSGAGVAVGGRSVIPLADDGFYKLNDLGELPFGVTLISGKDIEFDLEEKSDDRWEVLKFDRKICLVKVKHDKDGVWPFVSCRAEVEIDAVSPGSCEVIFRSTSGRKVSVVVTVKPRR